jgi:hypothetical protein
VPSAARVVGALSAGDALQRALEAEYAAIYGYAYIAARLSGSARDAATHAYVTHRTRCDALIGMLAAAHLKPDAAAPSYTLPFAVVDAASAGRLAAYMETRASAVYADLVAVTTASTRSFALSALTDAATRAASWGAPATPFPGLPELS